MLKLGLNNFQSPKTVNLRAVDDGRGGCELELFVAFFTAVDAEGFLHYALLSKFWMVI